MKSDKKKDALLSMIRQGKPMTLGEQARLVMFLATPAILAQLTTTMMQYIDASMVGSMGAQASASIGLMETTMWLLGSICSAAAAGFYVQVSHQLGSNDPRRARNTLRQGIMSVLVVSALIGLVSLAVSPFLPVAGRRQRHHAHGFCLLRHRGYGSAHIPVLDIRRRHA